MSAGRPDAKSVAISYAPGEEAAPRVAARGQGPLSEMILRVADEHGIPVHSDPILAEALYRFPEGDPIPPELYVAVAEVYAFLIRSRRLVMAGAKISAARQGEEQDLPGT
ncbi:MAG: EscU/YscU/HrcU family type III secretion system export apparatus switch protein [Deltaproteobacteria bacterium]|nr:EscU/YscU/HrcU family type III secretion system export apparatus switch protein [Deltaproteobacteria bacterium]